jgi:hypothetical protein
MPFHSTNRSIDARRHWRASGSKSQVMPSADVQT